MRCPRGAEATSGATASPLGRPWATSDNLRKPAAAPQKSPKKLSANQRAQGLALHQPEQIAFLIRIENDDGQVVLFAQSKRS